MQIIYPLNYEHTTNAADYNIYPEPKLEAMPADESDIDAEHMALMVPGKELELAAFELKHFEYLNT